MLAMESQSLPEHPTSLTDVEVVATSADQSVDNIKGETIHVRFDFKGFRTVVTCKCNLLASNERLTTPTAAIFTSGNASEGLFFIVVEELEERFRLSKGSNQFKVVKRYHKTQAVIGWRDNFFIDIWIIPIKS